MSDSFSQRLAQAIQSKGNAVCVGLDPRVSQLPSMLRESRSSSGLSAAAIVRTYCFGLLDVVASKVPIVKPQVAFFEKLGPEGMEVLRSVAERANELGLLVLLDAKRGDIGSTAEAYASAYLGAGKRSAFGGDALTVNPYLGDDTLEPFVDRAVAKQAGVFVLVKTSNPGSGFLQDLSVDQRTISQRVAAWVQTTNESLRAGEPYGPIGAVVGATYPDELVAMRQQMPNAWLLIPGYGSQGGTAADVAGAFHDNGLGAIVNSSRGIIFAYQREEFRKQNDWQVAVEKATDHMIADLRAHCPTVPAPSAS
jgi:orotidine-5'-phosphate decarboxylase